MNIFKFLDDLAHKTHCWTSRSAEEFRIVQCEDGLFRPQVGGGDEWQFVTWEGIDLKAKSADEAKYLAQRYISPNAFPEYKNPVHVIKKVVEP